MTAIPAAFEPPSLGKAWDLSVKHFATFLVLAIAVFLLGALGAGLVVLVACAFQAALGSPYGSSMPFVTGLAVGSIGALPVYMIAGLLGVLLSAIPAVYFATGEVITVSGAFKLVMQRPWRYLLAGMLFSAAYSIGSILLVPGLAVLYVGPVYINKIFTTDLGVVQAFTSSFSALYKSDQWLGFVGIQILVSLVILVASICSLGLLSLVGFLVIPASSFYIQNVAYRRGILS